MQAKVNLLFVAFSFSNIINWACVLFDINYFNLVWPLNVQDVLINIWRKKRFKTIRWNSEVKTPDQLNWIGNYLFFCCYFKLFHQIFFYIKREKRQMSQANCQLIKNHDTFVFIYKKIYQTSQSIYLS